MGLLSKAINGILLVCATGRIPKVGKLFRVCPGALDVLTLHDFPNNGNSPYNCQKFIVDPKRCSTFLVTKVQEGVPLWDLWVQVLYCSTGVPKTEEIAVGWIPYIEFNRMVLTEWDRWEEEKSQKKDSK